MQLNNVGLILMRRQALCHVVVVVVAAAAAAVVVSRVSLLLLLFCYCYSLFCCSVGSGVSSSQLGHATFAFAHAHFPYLQVATTQTMPRMSESCDLENASTENICREKGRDRW